jgi:hypothetical protein
MVNENLGDSVSSPQGSMPALEAMAVFRRLRGGSQSLLVLASDGALYVVKMMGNPQGPNVLANEALGSELAGYLGLPVPSWRPIALSDDFIDSHSHCWFESASGPVRPQAGVHFASRIIGQESSSALCEILPGSWIPQIVNRSDFAGMLLLDLWANHTDSRKSLFMRRGISTETSAVFVDNGHMFGGPWGKDDYRRGAALFLDSRIYEGLEMKSAFTSWFEKVDSVDEDVVRALAASIPGEWVPNGYVQQVIVQLQSRKRQLELSLFEELSLIRGSGWAVC